MKTKTMDETLAKIFNIRNLEYVRYVDLVTYSAPVLMLSITYDGGKELSLTNQEKYFNTFVKKVVQVYNDEKEEIHEDSLTDPFKIHTKIEIDDHTKQILESGKLEEINELYKFYEGKNAYSEPLSFNKDELSNIFPIIKYHLKRLLSYFDITIRFNDTLRGYRTNYSVETEVNGILESALFRYKKINDNIYSFTISNILGNHESIFMQISFLKDKIEVSINIPTKNVSSSFSYKIEKDNIRMIEDITKGDFLISYKNEDLSGCDNPYGNLVNFDEDDNFKWFLLPWKAYYGEKTIIEDINDSEKNVDVFSIYLGVFGKSFMKKEYYSKTYMRNRSESNPKGKAVLDECVKNTLGINVGSNIVLVETAFLPTLNSNGYYDEVLKDKYFYHILELEDLKDLRKENLVLIDKESGIFNKGDVRNSELLRDLVRRK